MRRVWWEEHPAKGGAFNALVRPKSFSNNPSQQIAVLAVPAIEHLSILGTHTENQFTFTHTAEFTARSLQISGALKGELFAVINGQRQKVCEIDVAAGLGRGNFIRGGYQTLSFADVTADRFELDYVTADQSKFKHSQNAQPSKVILSSEPKVAQVLSKQLGRMPNTPSPSWDAYIFDETVNPSNTSKLIKQSDIIDLTSQIDSRGYLNCTLPEGNWRIIFLGCVRLINVMGQLQKKRVVWRWTK